MGQGWSLPPLHLIVVKEKRIIALLEEDETIEEALLEKAVIGIEAQEHLHALV